MAMLLGLERLKCVSPITLVNMFVRCCFSCLIYPDGENACIGSTMGRCCGFYWRCYWGWEGFKCVSEVTVSVIMFVKCFCLPSNIPGPEPRVCVF